MLTPASMWRSLIACWASSRTCASATRSLIPSTRRSSWTWWAATGATVCPHQVQRLRQVQLALGVVGAQPRQRRAQRLSGEHVDARVDLLDLELLRRRVAVGLGLDDALHVAAGVAHHASIAAGVGEDRGRHRRAGAAVGVRAHEPLDRLGADERHVAAEHDHRSVGARPAASSSATAAATAPPVPLATRLHRELDALGQQALQGALGRVDDDDVAGAGRRAPRARATCTIASPQISCSTLGVAERIRVPCPAARITTVAGAVIVRMLARTPRTAPGGERPARPVAGGQGLEPRFSGPKPDVLPLDDPPRDSTSSHANAVADGACLTRRILTHEALQPTWFARMSCTLSGD